MMNSFQSRIVSVIYMPLYINGSINYCYKGFHEKNDKQTYLKSKWKETVDFGIPLDMLKM